MANGTPSPSITTNWLQKKHVGLMCIYVYKLLLFCTDNLQAIFFGYRVSLYFFFFLLIYLFCRCVGSDVLKWYSDREKNEVTKASEDENFKTRQLDLQAKLKMSLYFKVKSFGWMLFEVNTSKSTEAFWTVDNQGTFHAKLKGGETRILLDVLQPCVDLEVKKKENKVVIKMNPSSYRFTGMFVV